MVVYGVILLFIIATFVALFVSLFPHSQHPSDDFTESVGDQNTDNYALLPLYSSVYLVTIKLLQPESATAKIYISSSEPAKAIQHLPQKSIDKLIGGRRYNYNYYSGDQPIYLLPDSNITYVMDILNNNSPTCPIQLYLFDNFTSYVNFKNYQKYTAVASSPCVIESVTKSTTKFTWTFNITKQGSYYVGIKIDTGVHVTSNVSGVRIYYNITGLSLESPSECSQPLSLDHLSCSMRLHCSKFYCNRQKKYLLIKPTGQVGISYSFLGPPIIDRRSKYILFIFSIISSSIIIIIGCFFVIIIVALSIIKGCKKVFPS